MRCSIAYSYSEKIADYNNSFRATLQTNIHSCINQGYNSFFFNCYDDITVSAAEIICCIKDIYNIKMNIVIPYKNICRQWDDKTNNKFAFIQKNADSFIIASLEPDFAAFQRADEIITSNSDMILILNIKTSYSYNLKYAQKYNVRVCYGDSLICT